MLTWYRLWLMRQNEKTGHPAWWLMWALGWLVIGVWMIAALPWVGLFTGWFPSLGNFVHPAEGGTALLVYGRWIVGEPAADYYFLAVLFSIALAKMGNLLTLIGGNFGSGYIYLKPFPGAPLGNWVKVR